MYNLLLDRVDGPPAKAVRMRRKGMVRIVNKIIVDDKKCVGCKTCYKACFIDVIRWNEETKRPIIAYPEDCVNCMYCEASCPTYAIHIDVDYDHLRDWSALPGDGRPKGQIRMAE